MLVLSDDQVTEPGLIHGAADRRLSVGIDSGSRRKQLEEPIDSDLIDISHRSQLTRLLFDRRQLAREAALLIGGDVIRNCPSHGLFSPLEPLAADGVQTFVECANLLIDFLLPSADLVIHIGGHDSDDLLGDRLSLPLSFDGGFNEVLWQVPEAAGRAMQPGGAVEVAVLFPVVTLGHGVQQPLVTRAAAQTAHKVVITARTTLLRGAMLSQNLLDSLEDFKADQRLMTAIELQATPPHEAEVVAVLEQAAQFLVVEQSRDRLRAAPRRQPPIRKSVRQA